jgi:hypothetical protein
MRESILEAYINTVERWIPTFVGMTGRILNCLEKNIHVDEFAFE